MRKATVALLVSLMLAGCASSRTETADPLEGVNRKVYAFNEGLDMVLIKPLAKGYVYVTPGFVQTGVGNFFDNLFYPTVFMNQFLQGKVKTGAQDTGRFLINTTLGIAGLFDVATQVGLKENNEDFGQTFAVWGVGSGPYVVLPVLGPSTGRDTVGRVAGMFANPLFYIEDDETRYGLLGLNTIDTRARLLKADELVTGDKYLFVRDAYLQRRKHLINDGTAPESDPFLDGK